jgi:hypothetical protein
MIVSALWLGRYERTTSLHDESVGDFEALSARYLTRSTHHVIDKFF